MADDLGTCSAFKDGKDMVFGVCIDSYDETVDVCDNCHMDSTSLLLKLRVVSYLEV
ncbi:hypothetical protein [Mobiluncus sp.]|uniref:hypothetical protein n=1 Tax=Mobiluncus sp. TaxID=47293 RepID=UPI002A91CF67|nr:hypothetical protein [Mobiluncus sp.]MDY6077485.1 hypothetical protein [Mobiluncus sp.]